MRFCDAETYSKIKSWRVTEVSGDCMSQEDLSIFGIHVACSQPNMMDDEPDAPDFYWCRPLLKWLLA